MKTIQLKRLAVDGRIVIPDKLCERLGFQRGKSELQLKVKGKDLIISKPRSLQKNLQQY